MSAPHIPNLLSGRGGPRLRGGRGRGRGRGNPAGGHAREDSDRSVQATDTDAAVSRLSAVNVGFLDDPFASYFVHGEAARRLPIINRGTYTRTTALDKLIDSFITPIDSDTNTFQSPKQIISLGAGTDTRYFRLRSQNKHQSIIYHEFDFPSVCAKKWNTISRNRDFSPLSSSEILFPDPQTKTVPVLDPGEDWGYKTIREGKVETIYCCHSLDIRQLASLPFSSTSTATSRLQGLRTDIPTLIISECCLCYLEVEQSREIIKWLADRIPSLGIIVYEPIGPDDSFGQMMVSNLATRGIKMPSLGVYKALEDQGRRLGELGFGDGGGSGQGGQQGKSIYDIWEDWVPIEEKERLDALDGLDEVEEWQMLAKHYAVVWGWRGSERWEGWKSSVE